MSTIPIEIRFLLTLAGWLLPATLRADWRREWFAEFAHSAGDRRRMRARALGAFPDAWTLLRQDYGIHARLLDAAHSRSGPLAVMVLVLLILTPATGGFKRARALLFGHDYKGMVLVAQEVPFKGFSAPVPRAHVDLWVKRSTTVEPAPNFPSRAGVILRLRPGATAVQAEKELAATQRLQTQWGSPKVVPLTTIRQAPMFPAGALLGVMMILSIAAVRARTVRAWAWTLSKIVLCFGLIAAGWLECIARAPVTETGAPWSWAVYLLPLLGGGGAAWWLGRSARHYCPICARRLTMPVSIGLAGCLFEPNGVEYLCAEGHGAMLVVPSVEAPAEEVWTSGVCA